VSGLPVFWLAFSLRSWRLERSGRENWFGRGVTGLTRRGFSLLCGGDKMEFKFRKCQKDFCQNERKIVAVGLMMR